MWKSSVSFNQKNEFNRGWWVECFLHIINWYLIAWQLIYNCIGNMYNVVKGLDSGRTYLCPLSRTPGPSPFTIEEFESWPRSETDARALDLSFPVEKWSGLSRGRSRKFSLGPHYAIKFFSFSFFMRTCARVCGGWGGVANVINHQAST